MRRHYLSEPDFFKAGYTTGYPRGTTVDDLCIIHGIHQDNKFGDGTEPHMHLLNGTFKQMKSEYTRRYQQSTNSVTLEELKAKLKQADHSLNSFYSPDSMKKKGSDRYLTSYEYDFQQKN